MSKEWYNGTYINETGAFKIKTSSVELTAKSELNSGEDSYMGMLVKVYNGDKFLGAIAKESRPDAHSTLFLKNGDKRISVKLSADVSENQKLMKMLGDSLRGIKHELESAA